MLASLHFNHTFPLPLAKILAKLFRRKVKNYLFKVFTTPVGCRRYLLSIFEEVIDRPARYIDFFSNQRGDRELQWLSCSYPKKQELKIFNTTFRLSKHGTNNLEAKIVS